MKVWWRKVLSKGFNDLASVVWIISLKNILFCMHEWLLFCLIGFLMSEKKKKKIFKKKKKNFNEQI